MKRKTKVTMNDIARAAGVSQATVSLVLNQSRNIKLSDDTRQRVINVATELGYDRLPAVHAPRNQEEIALLVSSMQSFDPFIDAISQAREAAWRNETLLTVYDYGDDVELALNIIRQLDKRNCIGIILASPVTNVVDMTAFQDCTRIPLVLLNQRDPGSPLLPSFIPDDYANAFQVTRHLIACGATRIAHITGESWMEASRATRRHYSRPDWRATTVWCARPTGSSASPLPRQLRCWNWPSARTPSSAPATGWRLAAIRRWR